MLDLLREAGNKFEVVIFFGTIALPRQDVCLIEASS